VRCECGVVVVPAGGVVLKWWLEGKEAQNEPCNVEACAYKCVQVPSDGGSETRQEWRLNGGSPITGVASCPCLFCLPSPQHGGCCC